LAKGLVWLFQAACHAATAEELCDLPPSAAGKCGARATRCGAPATLERLAAIEIAKNNGGAKVASLYRHG